ncbi:MAG TPA: hypothetical protein VFC51_20360 [Chloroflexota bacterium]|nr:hypothetical protein [Chloroflexota bacterium]
MRSATRSAAIALLLFGVATIGHAEDGSDPRASAAEAFLPTPDIVPSGFRHEPKFDQQLGADGTLRILRMYTRGDPDAPTGDHASLLVSVAVSDTLDEARQEFADVVSGLEGKGYTVIPLDGMLGDEAVARTWDLYTGTNHPKSAAAVHFRSGTVTIAVQWTDNPDQPVLEMALATARALATQAPYGRGVPKLIAA